MKMAEGAKLQMCYLLHHLCDLQLRHRVESIVAFSIDYIGEIQVVSCRRFYSLAILDAIIFVNLGSVEALH